MSLENAAVMTLALGGGPLKPLLLAWGESFNSSSMGRFMSPDPLGGHLENPQSLNRYTYALNNPLSYTDPTGLDSYLECTPTRDNNQTCQRMRVGGTDKDPQMDWVQG